MTLERMEALLIEARDDAAKNIGDLGLEQFRGEAPHNAVIEDQRAVWHAAEVVLGILHMGIYVPKREAMHDAQALIRWLADDSAE